MEKIRISSLQLFLLMILSQIGSAVVIGIGMEAKQDAWLSILLAMVGGVLLFQIYGFLHRAFPDIPLSKYPVVILGNFFGKPLSILYSLYFFYIASRVLRDFSELIVTSLLADTPLLVILILMALVVFFTCVQGLEVLARTGEILFPYMALWGLLFVGFIFIAQLPKIENIQPILENGWKPVFQAAFPTILTFPFGETIIFLLIFCHLIDKHQVVAIGTLSIIISGLILMVATLLNIAVLGPTLAGTKTFPLLQTISKVNVGEVFQRLDPLIICILVVGGYFKISIFFCFAMSGFKDIFPIKRTKLYDFIFAILLVITSFFIAESYMEHIRIGLEIVPKYLHVPFQIVIPCLFALIVFIKKIRRQVN